MFWVPVELAIGQLVKKVAVQNSSNLELVDSPASLLIEVVSPFEMDPMA